jgi:hypothetical protein
MCLKLRASTAVFHLKTIEINGVIASQLLLSENKERCNIDFLNVHNCAPGCKKRKILVAKPPFELFRI